MDVFGGNWAGYEEKIKASWNETVGEGIGVIAGDLSWGMNFRESEKDIDFIKALSGTKIIVRGNHDYWWSSISKVREAFGENVYALQNDATRFEGVVFCGTRGWKVPERRWVQKSEDKKILKREVLRLELSLQDAHKKRVDGDKLVVVMHYPPFNATRDDSDFTKLMEKYNVDACIYGHLHGKGGRNDLLVEKSGIKYYLTSCDLLDHQVAKIVL